MNWPSSNKQALKLYLRDLCNEFFDFESCLNCQRPVQGSLHKRLLSLEADRLLAVNGQKARAIRKEHYPKFQGSSLTSRGLGQLCARCLATWPIARSRNLKPQEDKLNILFPYRGLVKKSILALKFSAQLRWLEPLSMMSALAIAQRSNIQQMNYLLCPFPSSKKRERHRGFNLPNKLCELLVEEGLFEHKIDFLERVGEPALQHEMPDKASRLRNVQNSLRLNQLAVELYQQRYPGRKILLVDDIVTSGATLLTAVAVLNKAGIEAAGLAIAAGPDFYQEEHWRPDFTALARSFKTVRIATKDLNGLS
ncbi:MAG: phosphoribosyltransferase family protein [Eubacteriales bacterium]|nr:phosphoribosyltransferase family protein [Eubacteriales bacterium]